MLASASAVALAAIVAVSGSSVPAAGAKDPAAPPGTAVYEAGTDGYDTFRIPAIVQAADGTLLAFAEGRVAGAGDTGDIDLVLKRSTDGGDSWGELQVVGDNGPNVFGNPAPVVDRETGRVILLTTHNSGTATETAIRRGDVSDEDSRRVFVQYSDDHGATWSDPREITAQTKEPDWRWYATGPVHGIQLRHEPYAGRLVIPANHSAAPPEGSADTGAENKYYGAHSLYSDDGGETWQIGGVDRPEDGVINPNENTAVELNDGRVYFNTRDQNGTSESTRAVTHSSDGGASFDQPYQEEPQLPAPVVQAATLRLSSTALGAPKDRLLFSAPKGPARAGMRISSSFDEGQTWTAGKLIWDGPAAYSDMVRLGNNRVGILYEAGVDGPYETITFARYTTGQLDAPEPPEPPRRVTVTPDGSGHGNDAEVYQRAALTEGRFGQALDLGADDYLVVPPSESVLGAGGTFTAATWFRTDSPASQAIMWAYGVGSGAPQWWIRVEPGSDRLRALVDTGSGSRSLVAPGNLADGAWHHVALTRSADAVVLYVDGVAVAEADNIPGSTSRATSIGVYAGQRPDGVNPLTGQLDELYLYNQALSEDEIADLATENAGPAQGQVLHLPLEKLSREMRR
ncbi:exo-alpha-sialidase [Phytoactinopolyspora alkaliphila]|uniref:exo-alpha-sialidase n=1 Tax=Phytoactinopolyspora alkaliphila TaxID=1783498 RepID=UPI001C207634